MRRIVTGALASLVFLSATACSAGSTPPAATAPGTPAGASGSATAVPTATAPAPATQGLGSWCSALEGSFDEVRQIMADLDGTWSDVVTRTVEPEESSTFEEALTCAALMGENIYSAPSFSISEQRFADEKGASVESFRDDSDPDAVTIDDVDVGDDAVYFTYIVAAGPTSANSFQVMVREGDRRTQIRLREPIKEGDVKEDPDNEDERRDQVTRIVELLDSRR